MAERGEIRNRKLASKLRDYRILKYNKITPTDIDGFVEFGNKLFVLIEGKTGCAPLPYGQKLALERLSDCCSDKEKGRTSILIICEHKYNDIGDIDVGTSIVRQLRVDKMYVKLTKEVTVKEVIDWFYKTCVSDK